ncbi:hypothetical protein I7I53_03297 [Histoplasma capsulatum var. duboisii H88]|uniref:Uncharacterized protein n=1 Tax=Ajellomyces capsulatus (strain H88) TaxID=544711 RepID=A0A8A1LM82_AJEC8|nr:hypothetical protein I7I53_03297 [Histoplasma capsulatum var. duboisii H88]
MEVDGESSTFPNLPSNHLSTHSRSPSASPAVSYVRTSSHRSIPYPMWARRGGHRPGHQAVSGCWQSKLFSFRSISARFL